jgi:acyl-homoserine lactone acylase PvdQ
MSISSEIAQEYAERIVKLEEENTRIKGGWTAVDRANKQLRIDNANIRGAALAAYKALKVALNET